VLNTRQSDREKFATNLATNETKLDRKRPGNADEKTKQTALFMARRY